MNQVTFGSSSTITSTSSKSKIYYLKKKKIFDQYSQDKKKFFQFSKQYATLASTDKLINTQSIQLSTIDNSSRPNLQYKSVSTCKNQRDSTQQRTNKYKITSPKSQILKYNQKTMIVRSQSKQSFLPQIINFRNESAFPVLNQDKLKKLRIHIFDPFYRVQDSQIDKKNILKMKKYKYLWKQSIDNRCKNKDYPSLLERSQQKAKKTIQYHNLQTEKKKRFIHFQQMLRDRAKYKKDHTKGQIQSQLQGLKGKGGLNKPIFQQIYMAQQTYKIHK